MNANNFSNIDVINAMNAAVNNLAPANNTVSIKPELKAAPANNTAEKTLNALKKAVAAIKSEMLTPRAIVRAIRAIMKDDENVSAFAAKIGVTPTSNSKQVSDAANRLINLLPYYTMTRIDENNVKYNAVILQPTSVDGVFKAKETSNIWDLLSQTVYNTENIHYLVKNNEFYKLDEITGRPDATQKVALTKKTDKTDKIKKAIESASAAEILAALAAAGKLDEIKNIIK